MAGPPHFRTRVKLLERLARFIGVDFRCSDHITTSDILEAASDADKEDDLGAKKGDGPFGLRRRAQATHANLCYCDPPGVLFSHKAALVVDRAGGVNYLLWFLKVRQHCTPFYWQSGQ